MRGRHEECQEGTEDLSDGGTGVAGGRGTNGGGSEKKREREMSWGRKDG